MRKKRDSDGKKGSLTIFAAISFLLIAELLFTLAEGVRQTELVRIAEMNTDAVTEAVLAEYCIPLWDKYQLLGYEASEDSENESSGLGLSAMTNEMTALSDMNFAVEKRYSILSQYNLLRLGVETASVTDYTLMTDDGGKAFVSAVSSYMSANLLYEEGKLAFSEAEQLYNSSRATESMTENSKFSLKAVSAAISAIEKAAESSGASEDSGTTASESSTSTIPVPESAKKAKGETLTARRRSSDAEETLKKTDSSSGGFLLSAILPSESTLSSNAITLSETVSGRTLLSGSGVGEDPGWSDKVYLEQYLLTRFSCFTDNKSDQVLNYELEYLIAGKNTDQANLKTVAAELLAIREAANLAYLASSTSKQELLEAFAETVSAVTVNPAIGEVVKAGLMAAWAYAESLMDLRALLAGKKIPAIKSDETWSASLENLVAILNGNAQAKESSSGISYKSYLGILLFMGSQTKEAMRAMDLIELTIRREDGYAAFRMDQLILEADVSITYYWKPLFLSFVSMLRTKAGVFSIQKTKQISYLKGS